MSTEERKALPASPGLVLRRLRVRTGRSAKDAAGELGWSPSKISRIENSKTGLKPEDLRPLLDLYLATEDERGEIEALLSHTRPRRGVLEALPETYERYAALEATAARMSIYGAVVVPGLLQTEEYAAAVIQATPAPEEHFLQVRLERRLIRQAALGRRFPLDVVLDEAVFSRLVGGQATMQRQVLRLLEFNRRPDITIRFLPFSVGAHPALAGQFAILDFGSETEILPHVFCDDLAGGVLRSHPDEVSRYRICFAAVWELTLGGEESTDRLAAIAESLRENE